MSFFIQVQDPSLEVIHLTENHCLVKVILSLQQTQSTKWQNKKHTCVTCPLDTLLYTCYIHVLTSGFFSNSSVFLTLSVFFCWTKIVRSLNILNQKDTCIVKFTHPKHTYIHIKFIYTDFYIIFHAIFSLLYGYQWVLPYYPSHALCRVNTVPVGSYTVN